MGSTFAKLIKSGYEQFNRLESLQGIASATSLRNLNIAHNRLASIDELSGLVHLRKLECSFNNIKDLVPLAELSQLEELWIQHNNIDEDQIKHLDKLVSLKRLVLAPNPCCHKDTYPECVVKVVPWLEWLDGAVVANELHGRVKDLKTKTTNQIDHDSNLKVQASDGAIGTTSRLSKRAAALDFMNAFPVQEYIPVGDETNDFTYESNSVDEQPLLFNGDSSNQNDAELKEKEDSLAPNDNITAKNDDPSAESAFAHAIQSLPTFPSNKKISRQPTPPTAKAASRLKTSSSTASQEQLSDLIGSQQESFEVQYPNSSTTAIFVRSDGSVLAKWPSGSIAVSIDREKDGFRIYAAHQDGAIALSFDSLGVGFVNYHPSGRTMISTTTNGDGMYLSPDGGQVISQWHADRQIQSDEENALPRHYKISEGLGITLTLCPEMNQLPIHLKVYFATGHGIRHTFVNGFNRAQPTEEGCTQVFGEHKPQKVIKKLNVNKVSHTSTLQDIRAAVAGLG